jgi:hypothetical protein
MIGMAMAVGAVSHRQRPQGSGPHCGVWPWGEAVADRDHPTLDISALQVVGSRRAPA